LEPPFNRAKRKSAAKPKQGIQPADALGRAIAIIKAKSTYTPEIATTICAMIGAGMALGQVADQRGVPCVRTIMNGCHVILSLPISMRKRPRHERSTGLPS
jgi:hypothetical protein